MKIETVTSPLLLYGMKTGMSACWKNVISSQILFLGEHLDLREKKAKWRMQIIAR
jgi:hypothetical protein